MPHTYDILIAGAGPAGCAAAYDLAQAGLRVLLLDKRSFPRPKACACGLTRKTLNALRYSVSPIVERTCHEIVLQNSPASSVKVHTRTPIAAMAVRSRFDHFCLQQTLAAGRNGGSAELRKIDSILAIREHRDHIELDIQTSSGTETLTAPVLIGADGSNGQTRRLTSALTPREESSRPEAPELAEGSAAERPASRTTTAADPSWYQKGFALEACVPYTTLPTPLPAGDNPTDLVFDFAPLPGGYGWLFPKGDHINIGVGTFADGSDAELKKVTRQLLTDYTTQKLGISLTAIDAPGGSQITGQYLGMGGHAYTPRGRVLLTGDAAGLVDPLTGEGIHSAIVSGQAAAAAILETLSPSKDFSSRPDPELVEGEVERPAVSTTTEIAAAYARHLLPLQQTLAFSARAAKSFYRTPERGMKAMRTPILRSLILKTYADGLPHTKLISTLAKLFT
jgi:flavin-dependent dehydrogenase